MTFFTLPLVLDVVAKASLILAATALVAAVAAPRVRVGAPLRLDAGPVERARGARAVGRAAEMGAAARHDRRRRAGAP